MICHMVTIALHLLCDTSYHSPASEPDIKASFNWRYQLSQLCNCKIKDQAEYYALE